MKRLVLLCVLTLAGCSHPLTLIDRDDGVRGTGTALSSGMGLGHGAVEIAVDGRTYEGRWTFIEGSSGVITARDTTGAEINCQFDYSERHSAGLGSCTAPSQASYDLLIGDPDTARTLQARRTARIAADHAKCLGYGFQPGTDAYGQCRMHIDAQRAGNAAMVRGLVLQRLLNQPVAPITVPSMQPIPAPQPVAPRTTICTPLGGSVFCDSY